MAQAEKRADFEIQNFHFSHMVLLSVALFPLSLVVMPLVARSERLAKYLLVPGGRKSANTKKRK